MSKNLNIQSGVLAEKNLQKLSQGIHSSGPRDQENKLKSFLKTTRYTISTTLNSKDKTLMENKG